MFKKLFTILFSVIMVLGMGTMTFAADASVDSKDEVIDQLNSIDFGRDVTFTALPQSKLSDHELLKFDSVEEAEAYLKKSIAKSSKLTMPSQSTLQNSIMRQINTNALAGKGGAAWYDGEVWWWGGGNTSLLSMTHAVVKFYYNGSDKISNITVKDSYMTGIVGATWTHRSGSATALGGLNAKYSVTGTWFIGISVAGYPVGASFNETLKSNTITMKIN